MIKQWNVEASAPSSGMHPKTFVMQWKTSWCCWNVSGTHTGIFGKGLQVSSWSCATAQQCTNSSNIAFKPLGGEDECRPPQLQESLPSLLSLSKQGAASCGGRPFLGGERATPDDREDCFGRATVALTRSIQHTYIVSPVDMAGLIGMAQTPVFHNGYHTLKRREVQFHGIAQTPTDAAAMLDWGLDTPFMSQDRPPLAIAIRRPQLTEPKVPPCHCPESQAASQSGSRHSTCIEGC